LDIFHQLEVCAALLDLLYRSSDHFVGEFAQDDAILQDLLVVALRYWLSQNFKDPVEDFLLLFLIAGLKISIIFHKSVK
jgi:hypothetical protein